MPTRAISLRTSTALTSSFIVALLLTLLNAAKPLCVDDVAYFYYARQIAAEPFHPYDFRIPWHQYDNSAWDVMAPPVMPYLWAPAIRLFGNAPVLWKLWFLPIYWLLAWALWVLFRRFARGLETSLLAMTALGPAILPGTNLMLEGPVLAFGLSGLVLFLRACDRRHLLTAALAGALIGLAMQTKYSALALLGPVVLYAAVRRRPLPALTTLAVALGVFIAWEAFIAVQDGRGRSYFLYHSVRNNPLGKESLAVKLLALVMYVGGLAPAAAVVGLIGLGAGRRAVVALGGAFALGYLILSALPSPLDVPVGINPFSDQPWDLRPDTLDFLAMGVVVWGVALALAWRVGRGPLWGLAAGRFGRSARMRTFLVGWLITEIVAALVLSPFSAARRVIGIVLALTALAGYAAARIRTKGRIAFVRGAAVGGVVLGLVFQGVDQCETVASRAAVREARHWIQGRAPGAQVWFSGRHGFEFYAQQSGMRPLLYRISRLEPGDWLVVEGPKGIHPEENLWFRPDPEALKLEAEQASGDPVPLTTMLCYYAGRRPMEHQAGPRVVTRIYRALKAYRPVPRPPPPERRRAQPEDVGRQRPGQAQTGQ